MSLSTPNDRRTSVVRGKYPPIQNHLLGLCIYVHFNVYYQFVTFPFVSRNCLLRSIPSGLNEPFFPTKIFTRNSKPVTPTLDFHVLLNTPTLTPQCPSLLSFKFPRLCTLSHSVSSFIHFRSRGPPLVCMSTQLLFRFRSRTSGTSGKILK